MPRSYANFIFMSPLKVFKEPTFIFSSFFKESGGGGEEQSRPAEKVCQGDRLPACFSSPGVYSTAHEQLSR
jgi:hypothetical protein